MQINHFSENSKETNPSKPSEIAVLKKLAKHEEANINLYLADLKQAGIPSEQCQEVAKNILLSFPKNSEDHKLMSPLDKAAIFHRAALKALGQKQFAILMDKLHIIRNTRAKVQEQL